MIATFISSYSPQEEFSCEIIMVCIMLILTSFGIYVIYKGK